MLLAVNGRGSFHREDVDLDNEADASPALPPGHPATPAPAPGKLAAAVKKSHATAAHAAPNMPHATAAHATPLTAGHAIPKDAVAGVLGKSTNATGTSSATEDMSAPKGGILMKVTSDELIYMYYGIVPLVTVVCVVFECIHK